MTSSTEQSASPHRRKHQWIGVATLAALAALVLPWLLTPRFDSIQSDGPELSRLPDPEVQSVPPVAPVIDSEQLAADAARLDDALTAPIGSDALASFVLQVGAFEDRQNAQALVERLTPLDVGRAYLRTESGLTRVFVGPFVERAGAEQAVSVVKDKLSLDPQIKPYDVREDGES
jgi:cell division septation protein DedD